jgi:hypothetical protein
MSVEEDVDEDVVGESGDGHQRTIGGVRGGRRLNIGKEELEACLVGPGGAVLGAIDAGFLSELERE